VNLENSVALVTGGASGLGLSTASELLKAGMDVVIVDLPGSAGEDVASELGDRAHFAAADVADVDAVTSVLDHAESLGALRVVVNSAGVGDYVPLLSEGGPFPLDNFVRVLQINLVGTFNVVRLAAERMAKSDLLGEERGVIVNTASVAAFDGQIGQVGYAASKGGVVAMTLPLARELASSRIRVVTIAPGLFDTPIAKLMPEAIKKKLAEDVPHPARFGDPGEFAALVRHIAENPMLNGEVIRLDGAVRMPPEMKLT
jgi:NAD(P)-dependent dehydrogenase (short-subunit alcohol dehydrogenase family)